MKLSTIVLMLLAGVAGVAPAAEYLIAPTEGSEFVLEVHKTGLMAGKKHIFDYTRYTGTLVHEPEAEERSKIRLAVESASAICKDTWVNEKQRQDIQEYARELMATAEHREMVFESSEVQVVEGGYVVTGELAIRGIKKPLVAAVEMETEGNLVRFEGSAVVDLREYGIKVKRAALGTIGTKRQMDLTFKLVGVRK